MILSGSEPATITIFSEPDYAADRAINNRDIILAQASTPDASSHIDFAFQAGILRYQAEKKDIKIKFGEATSGTYASIGVIDILQLSKVSADGAIPPISEMPEHFKVHLIGQKETGTKYTRTIEEVGIKITNPNNWLEELRNLGVDEVWVSSQ